MNPNLLRISKYAMCLFVAQVALGFTEGAILAPSAEIEVVKGRIIVGAVVSLLVAAAVFAVLSMRHGRRRWLQAGVVLLLYAAISVAFGWLVGIWLEPPSAVLQYIEWFVAVVGALLGTVVGVLLARWRVQPVAGIET